MKNRKTLSAIIFLTFLFLSLMILVISHNISWLDEPVGTLFQRNENLTKVMTIITTMGSSVILIVIALIVLVFAKDKKVGLGLFIGLGGVAGLNSILKLIICRPRPSIIHLVEESSYSFPSGHSASSMFLYGFLIFLIHRKCKNKMIKTASILLLIILILAVGVSRIYLGVHYLSDVIAGYSLSLLTLIIYCNYLEKILDK